jgi:hypothetical protein
MQPGQAFHLKAGACQLRPGGGEAEAQLGAQGLVQCRQHAAIKAEGAVSEV